MIWLIALIVASLFHAVIFYYVDFNIGTITTNNAPNIRVELNYQPEPSSAIDSTEQLVDAVQEEQGAKAIKLDDIIPMKNPAPPLEPIKEADSQIAQESIQEITSNTTLIDNTEIDNIEIDNTESSESVESTFEDQNTENKTPEEDTPAGPPETATLENLANLALPKAQLSDSFNIIQQQKSKAPSVTADFDHIFSPKLKHALELAVQEQKAYEDGVVKEKQYPITKDSDGTRYVDINGICWKIPPEGESGEWFIVFAGCNGQKKSFNIEFGISPEMFGAESPLSQFLNIVPGNN